MSGSRERCGTARMRRSVAIGIDHCASALRWRWRGAQNAYILRIRSEGVPMSNLAEADRLFFERAGLERGQIERIVTDSLKGADDGELYLEYAQSEALA